MTDKLADLAEDYEEFVESRNWGKFHTPQNLAMAISIEANELLEEFLWFDNPESKKVEQDGDLIEEVRDELADIIIYTLGMANQLNIDLAQAVEEKMAENEERFDADTTAQITEELDRWQ